MYNNPEGYRYGRYGPSPQRYNPPHQAPAPQVPATASVNHPPAPTESAPPPPTYSQRNYDRRNWQEYRQEYRQDPPYFQNRRGNNPILLMDGTLYNLVPFRNNAISRLLGTLFSAPEPNRSDDDSDDEEQKAENGAAVTDEKKNAGESGIVAGKAKARPIKPIPCETTTGNEATNRQHVPTMPQDRVSVITPLMIVNAFTDQLPLQSLIRR